MKWCGVSLLLPVALGCAGSGTVSGTVFYKGKPLTGGQVFFRPSDTRYNPATATIDPSGHYEVKVPTGEVQISVDNRALKAKDRGPVGVSGTEEPGEKKPGGPPPGVRGGPPPGVRVGPPAGAVQRGTTDKNIPAPPSSGQPTGTYVQIPEKYYDPFASGLTLKVTGGEQPFDIKLE